ncbi:aldo/keto reductase [Allostreptomyces psammosilenae]|uniref:Aryl-alcohol dehydrogenase-like predicted oxidoreductase n=1 Tax=Allostreptomyces psammosilenae TaxID=1892865 RepID=A0A853A8N8_9ACTN|nr:aldo/keto reductase [Allostreptomyces psammosilenae]NYI07001.1 aryl-alcohol dehydrogenase-like predicted oxidoreductase [Allostreptomyces psammosilenae]
MTSCITDRPPVRRLGTTDMEISTVGLGTWAIGGTGWRYAWGAQDDATSIATIRRAVEAGVNWIDTAPVYGLGHAEEVVGEAIAALPEGDRPLVFTKCGLVWHESDPGAPPRRLLRPESVRREVEASLRRLGVERIDLYQVHWPGDGPPPDDPDGQAVPEAPADATGIQEYWQVMADLRAEGKVRAIALSNHGLTRLKAAEAIAHVDAVQPRFSALSREAAAEIAWAEAHGTGVLAHQPMHSGLLSGAFSTERVAALPADDWRRRSPDFTTGLERNLVVVEAMRPIAERLGVPLPAVAVAWVLAWPGVTGAAVGARRPEQLDDWIGAGAVELTDRDLAEIATAIDDVAMGSGPVGVPAERAR